MDPAFSQAIHQWEQRVRKKLKPKVQLVNTLHQTWFAEKMGLLSQIRRASVNAENIKELEDNYIEITERESGVNKLSI